MENQHEKEHHRSKWWMFHRYAGRFPANSTSGPAMFDDTIAGKSIHDQYFCP